MPSGLQVWNQQGQILLDFTDKVLNLSGSATITVPANATTAQGVVNTGGVGGEIFFFVSPSSQYAATGKMPKLMYDPSAKLITWQQPETRNVNVRHYTIFWGFF